MTYLRSTNSYNAMIKRESGMHRWDRNARLFKWWQWKHRKFCKRVAGIYYDLADLHQGWHQHYVEMERIHDHHYQDHSNS